MFHQLKNLDTAFKHVRLFSLVLILANVIISCYALFYALNFADAAQQRVYIISDGKAIEAFASSKKDNIAVEARDHIKVFHNLFFTLSPDDKAITENLKRALYLADNSAKSQYDNLLEKGYYMQVVSANISQDITPDSIVVNTTNYPYYFRYYGKQRIVRSTSIATRSLITEGYIRDLQERSDNNPHGFLIERWTTLENRDLEITKR
ncbi:conjugative transposon protein TraK [Chitinophaga sp. Ak27]|uniref:conjugative transposon protein TraK n=1 Tax=Chitinophaga sp. Ak27 TaxID=2726116 RepID=UPI00145D4009|nr:conjugative transposon protein TraK [Chitinophaga sp. Ak27]NLU91378.1 conjugative transposon protein TraK [Chitinophaga sp. Ak27]